MTVIAWGDMVFSVNGRLGAVNVFEGNSGPVLRIRGGGPHRLTATTTLLRVIHAAASAQWKKLTASQVSAWTAYAQTLTRTNPTTGSKYTPPAYTAYIELATVFMRLNPGQFPPISPPTTPFSGDTISITITGSVPNIEWIASADNAPDVTTELLLHRLTGRNYKVIPKRLGVAGFVAYAHGVLVARVQVKATGMYHTGYRFIRTSTGQMSPIVTGPSIEMFL